MDFRRFQHEVVDSTSERAFEDLLSGRARHGDVHLATGQTSGRGRRGRSWWSPQDEGLYLSLVLLPPPPPWSPAALTMAAGLATFDASIASGLRGARLEWPNDLVVGGAKLAGVLVETRGLDPEKPHYVIGIGINVRQREFPEELRAQRSVASFRTLGLDVTVEALRDALLRSLSSRIDQAGSDLGGLAADYLSATGLQRRPVRVRLGEEDHLGELEGLSVEGGLLLREKNGTGRRIPLEIVRELAPSL